MPRGFRSDTLAVVVTTAATYVFNANSLPQGGIKQLHILVTGANNILDTGVIDLVIVKLEGVEVLNLRGPQLRVLLEGMRISSTITPAGALYWSIPMDLPSSLSGVWPMTAGVSGIPFGLNVSVEVTVTAGSSAGTLQIGWTSLDAPPSYMFKCCKQAWGVGAAATQPVPVNYGQNDVLGLIYCNAATHLAALRMVSRLGDGREFQVSYMTTLMMSGLMENHSPRTVIDPCLYLLEHPYKFPANSYYEIQNGAGGAVGDEFATLQVVDVRPATPGA